MFNIISIALISLLILSLGAFANNNNAKADSQSKQLEIKVKSDKVPQKVDDLAHQQFSGYAKALDKQNNTQSSKYELGEAFKIYKFNGEEDNSYYYPVIKDGKIVYILTLSPKNKDDLNKSKDDRNYSVKISKFIAKELNEIKDKNTNITVLTDEKGFYFEEDGKVRLVKATPLVNNIKEKESSKTVSPQLKQDLKATVTPSKIEESETIQNEEDQVQYENTLKNFKIREQQFDNTWCAGFSMAALLNATKNTDTYNAHDIMRTLYPNVSEEELVNCSTFPNQMIEFGKSQGRDIHYQEGVPSYNQVDQLTKDNVGIMILAQSISQNPNDPHLGHALAVVGNAKINDQEKIIYWNPWDTEVSIQDADSSLLHLSFNRDYNWYGSMIGY
ncbi:C47 family peptidase [Staphylococcus argenteus]|uniref:C47 family peptidase n=1 Tax=Staphylococcus argenteus TaxID=985002 RepID=UPI000977AEA5|nr:C47 family peptidase [Staphylococcus argenteus]OMH91657.1 cysteine protease [Staphylococcus argenteus]